MSANRDEFLDMTIRYILDDLSDEDKLKFQRMLNEADADMIKEFHRLQQTAILLSSGVEQKMPGWKVKERLIDKIYSSSKEPIKIGTLEHIATTLGFDRPQFAMGLTLFLALFVLSFGIYSTTLRHRIRHQKNHIHELQNKLGKEDALLSVLKSPRINIAIMNGIKSTQKAYGKIIWNPSDKTAILQLSNLPDLPKGKAYQLWIMEGKKPISAGIFSPKKDEKKAFFRINDLAVPNKERISSFKITMEPKSGVSRPTGKVYMMGKPAS